MKSEIKKGNIVARKSHNKDILFVVKHILKSNNKKIAILSGVTIRILADAPIEDLEIAQKHLVNHERRKLNDRLQKRIEKVSYKNSSKRFTFKKVVYTGKILHLDGDRKYTDKSYKYYKKMGLDAIVKYIPENKQPIFVEKLLEKYDPDILIITGHDGLIKKQKNYDDIYNYRNSRYFIETIKKARKWDKAKNLVIFAGACQSYFEALISAGANFASSPARILIDFADPLIVAEKVATTDSSQYIRIDDFAYELRDGKRGIDGIRSKRKKKSNNNMTKI